MTSKRQIILALKQKMNLSFIEKLDISTQECAYDLYIELDKLKEDIAIDLPQTLLAHISNLLEKYNDVLSNNSDLNTKLRNSNELLKKEIQKRIFFEENYKTEKKSNDQLTNDADEHQTQQEKKEREQAELIKQLKTKINLLNDEVSKLRKTRIPQDTNISNTLNQETTSKKLIIPEPTSGSSSHSISNHIDHHDSSVEITSEQQQTQQKKAELPGLVPTTSGPTQEITSTAFQEPSHLPNEPALQRASASDTPVPNQGTSSKTDQDPSSPPKIKNIFLIGDSHTRDLKPIMISKLPEQCYIRSFVKPGKSIKYLVDNIKPQLIIPGTQVIFFAGTNDVFRTPWSDIESSLHKLHKKLKEFQVMFILIPPRYDIRKINIHISKLNSLIKNQINNFSNFTYLNPSPIVPISSFRHDMIHLDRKGKHLLCNQIILKLFNKIGQVDSRSKSSLGHSHRSSRRYDTGITYTGPNHNRYKHYNSNMDTSLRSNKPNIPSLLNIHVDPHLAPPAVQYKPRPIHDMPPPMHPVPLSTHFAPPSMHIVPPPAQFAPPSMHLGSPPAQFAPPPMHIGPTPAHFAPPPFFSFYLCFVPISIIYISYLPAVLRIAHFFCLMCSF
uniref:Uncharacterized protein n=1 Tax=Cacopsylla melanoneura TaxID=428564 RepID=A0A8D8Z841_9HEMI